MYFGLCNSPATFQKMMNEIFHDMSDVCVVYIDDLMIFTPTDNQEEHDRIVLEVLKWLCNNDLFVKPKKCRFRVTEVDFLGMIVSCDGIKMDPEKVNAILKWPEPTNVKKVHAFLRLSNFYRRFIKDYAIISRPMVDLTCKDIMLNINYCCGLFTDYISARVHYSRVCSTLVPSVACQTTEGKYHSTNHIPTY